MVIENCLLVRLCFILIYLYCVRLGIGALLTLLAAVLAEKQHQQFTSGIEGFSKDQLKHRNTAEKNPLPDTDGS